MKTSVQIKLFSFLSCVSLTLTNLLLANPSMPTVIEGDVSFDTSTPGLLLIDSISSTSIINWEDFSIDMEELTTITLPDANSAILLRVNTTTPSSILGNLTSNGRIYLINPNGITIDYNSNCNLTSFIASTLDCPDLDFMSGENMNFSNEIAASIVNYGALYANGGDIILMGYQVQQSGYIYALEGTIAIGAGNAMTLQPNSEDKISIISQSPISSMATGIDLQQNTLVQSRFVQLKADGNLYEMGINHEGGINAKGADTIEGQVLVTVENGYAHMNGPITNRNIDSLVGGQIEIFAQTILLDNNCSLDSSGQAGGGNVNIGSKLQGMGAPFNAQDVTFQPGAQINADAGLADNGGQVVVWSNNATSFYGTITSRGGFYHPGDGGLVEVAGSNSLDFQGYIDNTATMGENGPILMD